MRLGPAQRPGACGLGLRARPAVALIGTWALAVPARSSPAPAALEEATPGGDKSEGGKPWPFFDYDCDLTGTTGTASSDWDAVHAYALESLEETGSTSESSLPVRFRQLLEGDAPEQAEKECPLGLLFLRVLGFYELFARAETGQRLVKGAQEIQRLLKLFPVYAIAMSRWPIFHALEHFSDLHAEIPKFFCEGVTGSLDWTAVRMDVHRWAKHRRKEYADANLTEVQVSLSGHLFTMMHSVTNQQSAQEECQFGFYCLMASQAIAASNMRTHFVRPYEFSLRNLLATVPFFEVSACGWPIFSTLTIFADLNKGEVFFTTGDRKYLRTFSDWNLRRDELSPLLRSDLDFLSPAWRTAAEASIEALVALPHAGYVRAIRDGVRHRENVDGPLREIVLQLVDVAVMVSAYAPPEHRLVYVVLLYGKNWSGILGRMARRFHQLGIRYPLLAVSVGAEAAASCRQIAAASGAPGTEHNIGKVICWTPGSESQVHRFTAVHALIHLGIDVIYMDMDTFMLRDPGPRILEQAEGYDAAFARHADADCINIGVFFLRAGPRTAVWFSQFVAWYHDHPFEIDQRGLQVFLGLPAKKVQIAFPPEDLVKVRSTVLEDVNEVVIANIGWHGHLSKLLIFHWCQLPLEQKLGQILAAYDAADAAEEHGLPLALAVVGAATPASGGSGAWAKVLQLQSIFRLAQKSEPPERSPCW